MREMIRHPFAPVYDECSRVLILGTMPSPASRAGAFYYGHPRNRFWLVLGRVFDVPPPVTVAEKRAFVLARGLALWDVLASCEISGASDASIRGGVPNDFSPILRTSAVDTVVCTGSTAFMLYQKLCKPHTGLDARCLPSTSAANARCSLDSLVQSYRGALFLTGGQGSGARVQGFCCPTPDT